METVIWYSLGGGGGRTLAVDLTNCFFEMENIVVAVVVGSMSVHDKYGLNTSCSVKLSSVHTQNCSGSVLLSGEPAAGPQLQHLRAGPLQQHRVPRHHRFPGYT